MSPLTPHPPSLPLTGADYFLHALDGRMRRAGGIMSGHVCRLVVTLDGTLDLGRLRRAVAGSDALRWLAGAHRRRRGWIGPPVWRSRPGGDGLPVYVLHLGPNAAMDAPPTGDVDPIPLAADRAPALSLKVLVPRPGDGPTRIVLAWHHALMDAHGAELLLRHIAEIDDGAAAESTRSPVSFLAPPPENKAAWRHPLRALERVRFARRALAWITESSAPPLAALTTKSPPRAAGATRFRVVEFDENETRRVDEHARRLGASCRRSLFYLALTTRALDDLRRRRGETPAAWVVPVPHDLRRAGARGPVFGNRVSFLFFRIEPDRLADPSNALADLTHQMTEQIAQRIPAAFTASTELFRAVPSRLYARLMRGPTQGRLASFFFSDVGERGEGLERFLGATVRDSIHIPPVVHPPGLTVVFQRWRERLAVTLAWNDATLDPDEADALATALRSSLVG